MSLPYFGSSLPHSHCSIPSVIIPSSSRTIGKQMLQMFSDPQLIDTSINLFRSKTFSWLMLASAIIATALCWWKPIVNAFVLMLMSVPTMIMLYTELQRYVHTTHTEHTTNELVTKFHFQTDKQQLVLLTDKSDKDNWHGPKNHNFICTRIRIHIYHPVFIACLPRATQCYLQFCHIVGDKCSKAFFSIHHEILYLQLHLSQLTQRVKVQCSVPRNNE